MIGATPLASLPRLRHDTAYRFNSYDRAGSDAEYRALQAGSALALARSSGRSCKGKLWKPDQHVGVPPVVSEV